jgi:plastocyanin
MRLHSNSKEQYGLAVAILIIGMALAVVHFWGKAGGDTQTDLVPNAAAQQPDTESAGGVQISIENFDFVPAEVTISPGTRVTWVNRDDAPHTATSYENKFNSGGLDTGDKFSFVFDNTGDYSYFCLLHPHMRAVIRVR